MAAPKATKKDRRGAPKGHQGNPKFVATDKQRIEIEAMVACGTQRKLIAELIGVSEDTLERHFRAELDSGKERALAKIGGGYVKKALAGDELACRFVLSRLGGWKQTTAVENSGPNGGPMLVEHRDQHDFSKLTLEEKRALEQLLAKASGGDEPA